MNNIPRRENNRRPIRTSSRNQNPAQEIARLHAQWVESGGKEGYPDDEKLSLPSGAILPGGKIDPRAIKSLRSDVDHTYNPNDWK